MGVLLILCIILILFVVLLLMMKVKIFSKDFGHKKGVLNQHVHTLYGLMLTYGVAFISYGYYSVTGIAIEIFERFFFAFS